MTTCLGMKLKLLAGISWRLPETLAGCVFLSLSSLGRFSLSLLEDSLGMEGLGSKILPVGLRGETLAWLPFGPETLSKQMNQKPQLP